MNRITRDTLAASIASVLKPLAKLMLMTGCGWTEFVNIAKSVFVEVASEDYGVRGRPTNISRVAAMTGLSRKEISKIRDGSTISRWTPSMEQNPVNTVIHYWHHDPDFCSAPGKPRDLYADGPQGFSALVKRYAGDIPPGAIRAELIRTGVVVGLEDGGLRAVKLFTYPSNLYDDFVRNITFAWANLGSTLVHNIGLLSTDSADAERRLPSGRFERSAWTERLSPRESARFHHWVRTEGANFIEKADYWIGQRELPASRWDERRKKTIGVGVYYFEEE